MSDDTNDKVIDFTKKSINIDENQPKSFLKEFQYVKLTKDDNGNSFKEESLREYAQKCFYIVTIMRNTGLGVALYKYKVPFDYLLTFLNEFRSTDAFGKIIDIERYIPEDLA
ncbi:MAG: hypothetical protein E7Z90_00540 [Cyanobacteria bacterium SIG29]|nr:hypothetical protein [Cyanobacteria bacterium SIG29]